MKPAYNDLFKYRENTEFSYTTKTSNIRNRYVEEKGEFKKKF